MKALRRTLIKRGNSVAYQAMKLQHRLFMDYHEQTDALTYDFMNVINRYREEFDLNHQTIVGVLEYVKLDLMTDGVCFVADLDEDDDEDDAESWGFTAD